MYKALTGVDLERVVYGKPELATYKCADGVIASWMEQTHNDERLPSKIYMIGNNPASDIIGGSCMTGTPAWCVPACTRANGATIRVPPALACSIMPWRLSRQRAGRS